MRGLWLTGLVALLMVALGACQTVQPEPDTNDSWQAGDALAYAPGRSGELRTASINGQEITYEVIDGLALYQSDMILGDAAEMEALSGGDLHTSGTICDHEHIASGFGWFCGRWENATVPYNISGDWGADDMTMRNRIREAIEHWEENTNIRFQLSNSGVRVILRPVDEGCSSAVGRQGNFLGDPQYINLETGCDLSAVIHEMGHAIGLWHEQARNDRDLFVEILDENIKPKKGHNFNRTGDIGNDAGPYDFDSIMHYHCYAFNIDGRPTIRVLADGVTCADLGDNLWLSDGDILSTYLMYPPEFSIAGVSSAIYQRSLRLQPSISAERAIKSKYLVWSIDGVERATGTSSPTITLYDLAPGVHELKLEVRISGVTVGSRTATFQVSNVAPEVAIQEPAAGQEFCQDQEFDLVASVFDADGFPDYTLPDDDVTWSSGGAVLGTGATATASFSTTGARTITVTASDVYASDTDSVTIQIVTCTGDAPDVEIISPTVGFNEFAADSDAHGYYIEVLLQGTATDSEDGVLSGASLVWTTDRPELQPDNDPVLATGVSGTVRLYAACSGPSHTITLSATDSDGNVTTRTRFVEIQLLC